MVAVTTRHLLENILFPNIVNNIHLHSRQMLTIPIVFFITSDSYTPRGMALQQEMEEVRASIRSLFKTHFRSKRVTLLTEFVYLQSNITLVNAIRSTFIESVVLFNQNNSVAYKTIKHIVGKALENYLQDGEQLSLVLQTALQSRRQLFGRKKFVDQGDANYMYPIFVLDVTDESVTFEDQRPYFSNQEDIIVIRSDATFHRGFATDPNFYSAYTNGNNTLNRVTSSIFEAIVGFRAPNHI